MVGRWVAPVPRAAGRPVVTDPSPDFRRCSWTTIQSRIGARAASPRRVRPWVVCRSLSDNFVIAPADIFVHPHTQDGEPVLGCEAAPLGSFHNLRVRRRGGLQGQAMSGSNRC